MPNEKVKMTLDVVGQEDDLGRFMQLMMFINECKMSGHHGEINLHIDGDGSASVLVYLHGEDDCLLSKDFRAMEALDNNSMWIGE